MTIIKEKRLNDGSFKNLYRCGYCRYEFEQTVKKSEGMKHSVVSDQVTCPRCTNMLPTWS